MQLANRNLSLKGLGPDRVRPFPQHVPLLKGLDWVGLTFPIGC